MDTVSSRTEAGKVQERRHAPWRGVGGGQGGGGAVGASNLQLLEQISLQFDTPCAVLEMAAADQELSLIHI